MISFYLALAASLSMSVFAGMYAYIAFALFFIFAIAASFVKRLVFPAAACVWLLVAAFYVWFLYDLLGLTTCILGTLAVVIGGLLGMDGVRRRGDIMFAIGIIFVILSILFKGNINFTAKAYFLPIAAFSGVSCSAVAGKKFIAVIISCVLGFIAGAMAYRGGGLFGEIYIYAVLYAVGATQVSFVISGFKNA